MTTPSPIEIPFEFKMAPSTADREKWEKLDKDTVVLHQFSRGKVTPSISPFPLKLETYLRIADIKYENDHKHFRSAKGKTPWITVNGKDVSDSFFIMEYLKENLKKDLSGHLKPEELAVARTVQVTLDDRFNWIMALDRMVFSKPDFAKIGFPMPIPKFFLPLATKFFTKGIKKATVQHGIGRHSEEEIKKLGLGDLKAFSDILGSKPYLMGDVPTEVDCSLFGFMVQVLYTTEEGNWMVEAINKDHKNLKDYVERMKDKYWPDWDECLIGAAEKKEAEKKEAAKKEAVKTD
jgi:glutathione S-transferase